MSSNRTRLGLFLAAAIAALASAGCVDQAKLIADLQGNLTDTRADRDRLALQLRATSQRADQLDGQVAALASMPADRWAAVPRPASLAIDGKSGLRTGTPQLGDSPTTQPTAGPVHVFARIYLLVCDQDGFPMRAVGPMKISLFDLSAAPPRVLGAYSFTPRQVARAYRSALGREIFAFDLPLNANPPDGRATVRVEFTDFLTGKTFLAEQSLVLLK